MQHEKNGDEHINPELRCIYGRNAQIEESSGKRFTIWSAA